MPGHELYSGCGSGGRGGERGGGGGGGEGGIRNGTWKESVAPPSSSIRFAPPRMLCSASGQQPWYRMLSYVDPVSPRTSKHKWLSPPSSACVNVHMYMSDAAMLERKTVSVCPSFQLSMASQCIDRRPSAVQTRACPAWLVVTRSRSAGFAFGRPQVTLFCLHASDSHLLHVPLAPPTQARLPQ